MQVHLLASWQCQTCHMPDRRHLWRGIHDSDMVNRDHDHSHDDDEFGNSLLTRDHFEPRPPQLGNHKIVGEQTFNGQPHYLISSTPKHTQHMQDNDHGGDNGSSRRNNWIDKSSLRLNRIQLFDNHLIVLIMANAHAAEFQ